MGDITYRTLCNKRTAVRQYNQNKNTGRVKGQMDKYSLGALGQRSGRGEGQSHFLTTNASFYTQSPDISKIRLDFSLVSGSREPITYMYFIKIRMNIKVHVQSPYIIFICIKNYPSLFFCFIPT